MKSGHSMCLLLLAPFVAGCGLVGQGAFTSPAGATRSTAIPTLSWVIDRQPEKAVPAIAGSAGESDDDEYMEVPVAVATKSDTVRLIGRAYVSLALNDVANAFGGKVADSDIEARDALNGRVLGRTVTAYDGSFVLDVVLRRKKQPVLVSLDLVQRDDPTVTTPLQAPVLLRAGEEEKTVNLSPGTTALATLMTRLAIGKEEVPAEDNAVQTLNSDLGTLITFFDPKTLALFLAIAERAPELKGAVSLQTLKSGIADYVKRLIETAAAPASPAPYRVHR